MEPMADVNVNCPKGRMLHPKNWIVYESGTSSFVRSFFFFFFFFWFYVFAFVLRLRCNKACLEHLFTLRLRELALLRLFLEVTSWLPGRHSMAGQEAQGATQVRRCPADETCDNDEKQYE
jgi:hypothetical protein